jgi:hypothetical protein
MVVPGRGEPQPSPERYVRGVATTDPAGPAPNPFRERLPFVLVGAAIFVVLLVITAVSESNTMGSIVAVYGVVGGVLLGRLLARGERRVEPPDVPAST